MGMYGCAYFRLRVRAHRYIYKRGVIIESSLVPDGALWVCMVVRTSDYACVRIDIYIKEVS